MAPAGVSWLLINLTASTSIGYLSSKVAEPTSSPKLLFSGADAPSLMRARVKCGTKGRSSLANPSAASAESMFCCNPDSLSSSPPAPTQKTRACFWLGKTPRPEISKWNGETPCATFFMASVISVTRLEGILPRNFKVRWIPPGSTHLTNLCSSLSNSLLRLANPFLASSGSSIAIKERICSGLYATSAPCTPGQQLSGVSPQDSSFILLRKPRSLHMGNHPALAHQRIVRAG